MAQVLIDRNARTAIVVGKGRKFTHMVQMQEGELRVQRFLPDDLEALGFREIEYDAKRAARKYLRHSGGVSFLAKAALKTVLAA